MPEKCDNDYNCSSCGHSSDCQAKKNDFRAHLNDYSTCKKVYVVMSGKGGVGKSMVTSLLASQMNKLGYRVGILDADITGPSIPKAFGITTKAKGSEIGIHPEISRDGVEVMSINLVLENETDPVIWRGPVISGVIKQFYEETVWGDLDFMFVDMPPGTGDVPLTVFQSLPVDGIIVVTSPQELVSMIVNKAVKMAKMMNKDVVGLVENLSYFHCPDNNKDYKIFGDSHIDEVAKEANINLVTKLPINPELANLQDNGLIEDAEVKELEGLVNYLKSQI
ncbi:MAG: Mrp/NBP35 family ATP-binding protein [Gammaproteobacteria bacterium]|nr:Mrp/NBP35 family ATP-binding protein [Gammaproteobacteria bacterium]